jgi:hypothetical protein
MVDPSDTLGSPWPLLDIRPYSGHSQVGHIQVVISQWYEIRSFWDKIELAKDGVVELPFNQN